MRTQKELDQLKIQKSQDMDPNDAIIYLRHHKLLRGLAGYHDDVNDVDNAIEYYNNIINRSKGILVYVDSPGIQKDFGKNDSNEIVLDLNDLDWSEIKIQIFGNNKLRINYDGKTKDFSYSELGFADKRNSRENRLWKLLLLIEYLLAWDDSGFSQELLKSVKNPRKDMSDLNKKLKAIFNINSNPFKNEINTVNGKREYKYLPNFRFNLRNDTKDTVNEYKSITDDPRAIMGL